MSGCGKLHALDNDLHDVRLASCGREEGTAAAPWLGQRGPWPHGAGTGHFVLEKSAADVAQAIVQLRIAPRRGAKKSGLAVITSHTESRVSGPAIRHYRTNSVSGFRHSAHDGPRQLRCAVWMWCGLV